MKLLPDTGEYAASIMGFLKFWVKLRSGEGRTRSAQSTTDRSGHIFNRSHLVYGYHSWPFYGKAWDERIP